MKSFLMLLLCVLFLFAGCAAVKPFPQCNDSIPKDAMLYKIADELGVCLDNVGRALILANGINISLAKLYTAEQAIEAVDDWIKALSQPITDTAFQALVSDKIDAFPELMIITDDFKSRFNTNLPIDEPSREIMVDYLVKRVRPMLEARIKAKK